jgi:hypothetical protein
MAAQPGENEGFRLLDDFVCEATPAAGVPVAVSPGRGLNAGARMIAEVLVGDSRDSPSAERVAQLRALSNQQLLAFVRSSGAKLNPNELRAIHDIAIERLTQDHGNSSEGADELSREAMLVSIRRMAS